MRNDKNKELLKRFHENGLCLPFSDEYDLLGTSLSLYGKTLKNRIGILPLEGFDSNADGSPSEYVKRRYLRFVKGGAGLVWFEACAVSPDGKSNPFQMMLTKDNMTAFNKLLKAMDDEASAINEAPVFKVLQLTHSGRMSKSADWDPIPLAAKGLNDPEDVTIASDERIRQMIKEHIEAAQCAYEAGFDAVDIKVCHGYFLSELLSAFNREGEFGGSFENRTRALFSIIDGIKERLNDKIGICVRLNAYDSVPFPYGFGIINDNGVLKADLSETVKICKMLADKGVKLINLSASSPKERLFGNPVKEAGLKRYEQGYDLLYATKLIKEAVPDVTIMCTGLSGFNTIGPYIAAGGIKEGWFDIAGFGRQGLACPGFAHDILSGKELQSGNICTGCGQCFALMDAHSKTGCIVRDKDIYFPLYQKYILKK